METRKKSYLLPLEFLPGLLLCGGLILVNLYNYLLFHILVELFIIIISFTTFVIYWNSRQFLKNNYFLFVAFAYFFVNVFDLTHILTYEGLGILPESGMNLPSQLWVIARYFQAASLIVATLYAEHKLKRWWLVVGIYGILSAVLLSMVFIWPIFPDCYIDGIGLTPFIQISEYIISALYVISVVLLVRVRERFAKRVFMLLVFSIGLLALAEIMFAFYFNVFGIFNLIGHLLRIGSYYLAYKALIQIGLQEPYQVLFRNVVSNEEALQTSEEKYRNLVENINEVIFSLDIDGRITYISPVVETMLGYQVDEAIGVYFYEAAFPDDHAYLILNIDNVMAGQNTTFKCRLVSDTGSLRWIRVSCKPLVSEQGVVGAQGVMTDITEQHIAEEMLHIKNSAVEAAFTGIAVADLDGIISYANPAFASMFGYQQSQDVLGKAISDLIEEDNVHTLWMEGLQTNGHWVGDMECHRQDGSPIHIELFTSLVRDEVNHPLCYMGSFLDITERKRTERWRYLYEQLLKTLLDMSQSSSLLSEREITQKAIDEAVMITGSEVGYIHYVDADSSDIHLTSSPAGLMEFCSVEQSGHSPLEKAGVWADCIRMQKPVIHNNYPEMTNKKGYPRGHVDIRRHMSVPVYNDGEISMVLGVGNKLTEYTDSDALQVQLIGDQVAKIIHRKRAEEGLKTSLREKVVLLQEIHHRVKNNLQVVSSLLDMQAMKVKEPQMQEVLQDSRNRVRTMAFVHDRLYRSGNLAMITASEYIPSLVNYLFGVYAKMSSDIQLNLSVEDVALSLDVAVPCGLIINELVSNALKYAFTPLRSSQQNKEIRVYIGVQERGHFTMIISDNGVGLPKHVDIGQTPSLGLQLVGLLVLQIGGKIELERGHGVSFRITAPL